MIDSEKLAEDARKLSAMFFATIAAEITTRIIKKDINEDKGFVGVRHSGDFCDGCTCDDKVCETCPWAQYVPDTRK